MSRETTEWLNENVLVGFTEQRGNAWHWKQGTDNHYPAEIPVEDVRKRLFGWEPLKVPMLYSNRLNDDDLVGVREFPGKSVIIRGDNGDALGAVSDGYQPHGYSEWLTTNVSNMLDDSIQIGSAGLLKGGAVAWVQVELAETLQAHGVAFRPTLLATTSLDGSIASTYKAVNTIVVCDNTRDAAISEKSPAYRVKHTSKSTFKVQAARDSVGIQLAAQADAFSAEIDQMLGRSVDDQQLMQFMDTVLPVPAEAGRSRSIAVNKRETLLEMYWNDPRVALWKGTVFGVFQLMNTWRTHEASFKGGNRVESQMMSLLKGDSFTKDAEDMKTLDRILMGV